MLARIWHKLAQRRRRPGFQSRFGGLWTDRPDAHARLERKREQGEVSDGEVALLRAWIDQGYTVLRGAVAVEVIERVNADVAACWEGHEQRATIEIDGQAQPLTPELRQRRAKLVDLYVHSQAAREALFAAPMLRFLTSVFERDALLFQSLSFEYGSEQPMHQDVAYVVVSPPMELVASWIALEDIRPGSGELGYYPGSQRLPEHLFGGARNWNRERHGEAANTRYLEELVNRAGHAGLEHEVFLPQKGDVLFWNADLAHGGCAVTEPELTRKSLVGHYCPTTARPYYVHYRRDRRTRKVFAPGATFASSHHAL